MRRFCSSLFSFSGSSHFVICVRWAPLVVLLGIPTGVWTSLSQQTIASGTGGLRIPPPPSAYAGDNACAECHTEEAKSYFQTRHHRDSSSASRETILGNFAPGKNILRTRSPNLIFAMLAEPDGFYEGALDVFDPEKPKGKAARIDVVFGSGRNGQTYLYWKGDELFEMPVSYWSATGQWINSPGYRDGEVHFDVPIMARCLECHSTTFQTAAPPENRYVRDSLVLGIGCEKCHGPGAQHVARERSAHPPPAGSADIAIVNPARLPRERQMDVCALCHAGAGTPMLPSLSFRPGDDLAQYVTFASDTDIRPVDVHGKQVEALKRSKCFSSRNLTCMTCHNVHESQENPESYSAHCLECHRVDACPKFRTLGHSLRTRCVECHMPVSPSAALTSASEGKVIHAELREHRIAVYRGN